MCMVKAVEEDVLAFVFSPLFSFVVVTFYDRRECVSGLVA